MIWATKSDSGEAPGRLTSGNCWDDSFHLLPLGMYIPTDESERTKGRISLNFLVKASL
ncbi:MAG TPA: hypothetical protein VJJ28_00505 [Candidatus Paceibacterota bacterium]